jgi:hypothetical protein
MDTPFQAADSGPVRPLAGDVLLSAWERGTGQSPGDRALTLLSAGFPQMSVSEAAALSVAQRDLALVHLRRSSFGAALSGFCVCSGCGERLEFVLADEVLVASLRTAAEASCTTTRAGYTLRLRPADSVDIAAAAVASDVDAGRALLLARCIEVTDPAGQLVPLDAAPDEVREEALAQLVRLHDAAELSVSLSCPGCDARNTVFLDIANYLWTETRHAARVLVDDVHELAWAYGWSEHSVLAMNPVRRRAYLERLRS